MSGPVLVTGNRSGLGRYLYENLPGSIPYNRDTAWDDIKNQEYDLIVHAAFRVARDVQDHQLYDYYRDTVGLTEKLTTLKFKKFIFISSIDVYPKDDNKVWDVQDTIIYDRIDSVYGQMKILCESVVQHHCPNHLILRVSALIGPYMRKNNYLKIVEDDRPKLSLTADSKFNFVEYNDVLRVIEKALPEKLRGPHNFVSDHTVTLGEVAKKYNKNVEFGQFTYISPQIAPSHELRVVLSRAF
jgi:nucleoside-diphosphate-sugar epimerase